jgi:hypothetical protein
MPVRDVVVCIGVWRDSYRFTECAPLKSSPDSINLSGGGHAAG